MSVELSTKVLYSLYRYCLAPTAGAGSEQIIVRKTSVEHLALRWYGSVRSGRVFYSGRQHVQGHR
jgi:hypothetical protein